MLGHFIRARVEFMLYVVVAFVVAAHFLLKVELSRYESVADDSYYRGTWNQYCTQVMAQGKVGTPMWASRTCPLLPIDHASADFAEGK